MRLTHTLTVLAGAAVCTFAGVAGADEIGMTGRIRDFMTSHPDMEYELSGDVDKGIVQDLIGGDGKPVYAGGQGISTNGEEYFDQWYNDTNGVNMGADLELILDNTINANPHIYTYKNLDFWPVDNQMFGNEGNPHNQHFTFELHTTGTYFQGDVLRFKSDDDMFVFLGGWLFLDLGGVHKPQDGKIFMDDVAAFLGLNPGDSFDYDLFYAERHTKLATLKFDVPIPAPGAGALFGLGACFLTMRRRRG
ncbi:MAG: fibro-slime domain-containing protein [Planctomycetes bacterium]|nr:fibro-slime domain-containing protein [Planctomycetota bacterium]